MMTTTVETLSSLGLMAGLREEALRRIMPHVHERTYRPGQVIVLEGEGCEFVYLVARGLVRARRLSPEGREQVLAYVGPGGTFNLVCGLDGGPSLATVDAVTEAAVYAIAAPDLREIMGAHREVALAAAKHLAAEVRRLTDLVESLALHTVRTRLARFLLSAAEGTHPARHWTQDEIAVHIGTVREMVGRSLRDFAAAGWIRRERGRVVIVDREELARVASGSE